MRRVTGWIWRHEDNWPDWLIDLRAFDTACRAGPSGGARREERTDGTYRSPTIHSGGQVSVSISGTFKQDQREYNGLEAIEDALIKYPLTHRYAVIRFTTLRITEEVADGGVRTPTVRLLHIEPVDGDNEELVKDLLAGRFQARTGSAPQETLPIEHDADDGPVSERKPDKWLDPAAAAAAAEAPKGRKGKTPPPAEFSTTEA